MSGLTAEDWDILDEKLHTHPNEVLPVLLLYQDALQLRKTAERQGSTKILPLRKTEQERFKLLRKILYD